MAHKTGVCVTGCVDGANVFVASDIERVNCVTHITYHCYSVHNDGYTAYNHVPDHFRLYLNCRFECLLIVLLNYSATIRDQTDMPMS